MEREVIEARQHWVRLGEDGIVRDARGHLGGEEGERYQAALALTVGSPVARVIGSFFMGLNKPRFPSRMFTSEAEASEWPKEFVEQWLVGRSASGRRTEVLRTNSALRSPASQENRNE
jgi:hypothetical protein